MVENPVVLIVDDEQVARKVASSVFEAEGYKVLTASNGDEMKSFLRTNHIDLILLDINLPGKNGLILARELREITNIGLIFVTSRDNDIDRILGLEIGADDYITKPFNPRELTIRSRNLINRTRQYSKNLDLSNQNDDKKSSSELFNYVFNNWKLDVNSHELTSPSGTVTKLPRTEFRMLQYLCEHPKLLVTRSELMKFATGRVLKDSDRTVDVTIRKLRKHLSSDDAYEIIETIHGEGYRFGADVSIK
ncbi:MAG: two-component system response regulator ArcA [Succinivibrionaceae bacterium]